jgi:ankyrin repeat protein
LHSEAQYKRKLKAWNIQKNQKGDLWKDVSLTLKRKNLDATDVDVFLNGILVPTKKLKREISRYDLPTLKLTSKLTASASRDIILPEILRARTPDGITIRPKIQLPRCLRVELPWHDVRDQIDRIIPKLFPTDKDRSPSPLPSAMLDFSESDSIFELVTPARHSDFVSDKIASVLNVSMLATRQETLTAAMAMMAPYMPEKYEKETLDSINQLIDPTSSKRMQVLVSFMALLLANDVLSYEKLCAFVIFLDEVAGNQAFDMLPLREEPSTQAFISQLLFAAVRMDVPRLLQSAVKNKVNINCQSAGWRPTTLILEAVKLERLRIIQLLINAAADLQPIRLDDSLDHHWKCPFYLRVVEGFASEVYGVPRFYCPCEAFWFSEREVCSRAASTRIANEVLPLLLQSSGTVGPGPVTTLAIRHRATSETIEKVIQGGGSVDECYICVSRPFHDDWLSESMDVCTLNSTPLSAAATSGDAQLVRLLLEYGADPNGPVAGYTSDFLVDWGEYFYKSPLVVATEHNNLEIVQLLLKHGADPNLCPLDALQSAEKDQLIRGFHNKNLYEDDMDDDDTVRQILVLYPLQAAASLTDTRIAEVLLTCGANVNPMHGTPPSAIAACYGRSETLSLLLSKGATINPSRVQDFGMSALEGAVLSGDESMVERMLLTGADPNGSSAGRGGGIPLQRAAEKGSTAIFDSLLKAGANLDSSLGPNHGATILYWSVKRRNHARVKWLLCSGVNPNGDPKDRKSPLTAAILVEDLDLVSLLIEWGADTSDPYPMRKDLYKGEQLSFLKHWAGRNREISLGLMPPLQLAVITGQLDFVACLCSSGADVNGTNTPSDPFPPTCGLTALHLAVARRSKDIITYLLARGADINCLVSFHGKEYSPLCISVCSSDQEITELLLREGANPYVPIAAENDKELWHLEAARRHGVLPLEHACVSGDEQIVSLLLSSGVDVHVGCPLVYAFDFHSLLLSNYDEPKRESLSKQMVNIMELLLAHGAKVNQRFVRLLTPLQAVICRARHAASPLRIEEDLHCARRLIELGAEINAPPPSAPFGRTALQAAVEVGDVEFVQFLLKEGAEVNAPAAPRSGVTALQAAAMMGYLRIAPILLEHGADIDADPGPEDGLRAIDGAAGSGGIDMVKLLLDNYNGPRSISDVCASAMEYAKGENQWYVMEFLKKYEPPT